MLIVGTDRHALYLQYNDLNSLHFERYMLTDAGLSVGVDGVQHVHDDSKDDSMGFRSPGLGSSVRSNSCFRNPQPS